MAYTIINSLNFVFNSAMNTLSGNMWEGCYIVGNSSGATGFLLFLTASATGVPTSYTALRLTGTNFTAGETVNVKDYGGATVGSFITVAGSSGGATKQIVTVTGTDTANLLKAVYDASVSGAWGYHSINTGGKIDLDCTILVGRMDQSAVTSAVSQEENVELTGNVITIGNDTYGTTFDVGIGTYGEFYDCQKGSTIVAGYDNTQAIEAFGGLVVLRFGVATVLASTLGRALLTEECYFQSILTSGELGGANNYGVTTRKIGFGSFGSGLIKLKDYITSEMVMLPNARNTFVESYSAGASATQVNFRFEFGNDEANIYNVTIGGESAGFIGALSFVGGVKNFINTQGLFDRGWTLASADAIVAGHQFFDVKVIDASTAAAIFGAVVELIVGSYSQLVPTYISTTRSSACFRSNSGETLTANITALTTLTGAVFPGGTSLNVGSTAGMSGGDHLHLDNEVILIVSVNSGTNLTITKGQFGTVDDFHTGIDIFAYQTSTMTVSDGTAFTIGNYIRVDVEDMKILNIVSDDLTLDRAMGGSFACVHNSGVAVYDLALNDTTDASGDISQQEVLEELYDGAAPVFKARRSPIFNLKVTAGGYDDFEASFIIGSKVALLTPMLVPVGAGGPMLYANKRGNKQ